MDAHTPAIHYVRNDFVTERRQYFAEHIDEIETALGYKFKNRQLLEAAFAHDSVIDTVMGANPQTSLHMLGDSVLRFTLAKDIYHTGHVTNVAMATNVISKLLDKRVLAKIVTDAGIDRYLIVIKNLPPSVDMKKTLLHAIAGAIWADNDDSTRAIEHVSTFVARHFPDKTQAFSLTMTERSSKEMLSSLCEKTSLRKHYEYTPCPETIEDNRSWITHLVIRDQTTGAVLHQSKSYTAKTQREGEKMAAAEAIDFLEKDPRFREIIQRLRFTHPRINEDAGSDERSR